MHRYKIWNRDHWMRTYTRAQFVEAEHKGLVEHDDEMCPCLTIDDDPPF